MTAKLYAVPTDYACPSWCVRWDYDANEVGPGMPAMHYAEDIGACGPQGNGYRMEVIVHFGDESAYLSDPEKLRSVAADMLKAAQWLEAHQ